MEGSATLYAVIDIGSNSTRLMLASKEGGRFVVADKKLQITRIGDQIASRETLSEEGMERTIRAMEAYVRIAKEAGAGELYAFATSAVRDAKNKRVFVERCQEALDIEVDVLDGRTEALLAYMGVMPQGDAARVIDIGGGSTELIAGQEGKIRAAGSLPLGAVRAKELYPQSKGGFDQLYKAVGKVEGEYWEGNSLEKRTLSGHKLLHKIKKQAGTLYGVGGTITTICALSDGVSRVYDPRTVHGRTMTRSEVTLVLRELDTMSSEELKRMPLLKGREDIIRHGGVILMACLDAIGAECLVVSDRDNLEGYLAYRAG